MTTDSAAPALAQKPLHYTHEAMVDFIIAEPTVTPAELAQLFGRSRAWISKILASDSFQARLADRKAVLLDPTLAATLDERIKAVTLQAVDMIGEKLNKEESASFALEALATVAQVAFQHGIRQQ